MYTDLRTQLGFETIRYQKDHNLFNELSILFQGVKDTLKESPLVKDTQLKEIIKVIYSYTGVLISEVSIDYSHEGERNVSIILANIDRNSPLRPDYVIRQYFNNNDLRSIIRSKRSFIFKGGVDREHSKVTGDFNKIGFKLFIHSSYLKGFFTSEELAAIILHEIGHAFTLMEYMGTMIVTNLIIHRACKEILGTDELKKRLTIVEDLNQLPDFSIDKPYDLLAVNDETVLQTLLYQAHAKHVFHELDSYNYDLTSAESQADQFCARHGGGKALVTALYKVNRLDPGFKERVLSYNVSSLITLWLSIEKTSDRLITLPFILFMSTLGPFFIVDPTHNQYDKTKTRFLRIKQDLVHILKNRQLDKEERAFILESIQSIEIMMGEVKERDTFLEKFWLTLYPSTRRGRKAEQFQKELEALLANDLFIKSEEIRSL